jgi:molybdate transport system ATP-binding protein
VSGLSAQVVAERGGFRLDVELAAAPGEVLGVLGPNGAGKTTLLRVLCGLTPVSDGRVALAGQVLDDPGADVFVPPERRPVGVVFQDYLLFPHLSVLENVAFSPRARGVPRQEARRRAHEWLDRLGVAELARRRPTALSGGQAQRVALARALAGDPALVLLDEPLAALDAGTRQSVRTDLRSHLAGFGGPALLVTHDPLEAMVLADRLLVMDGGRAVQRGTPAEVARRPATDYVARLVGLNLYRGTARDGAVQLADGGVLHCADVHVSGAVFVALRPAAVALHANRPEGSPRNVWAGRVAGLELFGDRVRVQVAGSPAVLADVTPGAVADLGLAPDRPVWVSAKASELEVYPTG